MDFVLVRTKLVLINIFKMSLLGLSMSWLISLNEVLCKTEELGARSARINGSLSSRGSDGGSKLEQVHSECLSYIGSR